MLLEGKSSCNTPINNGAICLNCGVFCQTLYNIKVPYFVKTFLEDNSKRKYKVEPVREIQSSILHEFLMLGRAIEITLENLHELKEHQMAFETAGMLLMQGGRCYKAGFDASGQTTIERLLYKISHLHGFEIYEEYKNDDGEVCLRKRSGPARGIFPANNIYVRHLSIERLIDHFVTVLNPERVDGEFSELDIVVKFYDPYIQTPNQIDKKNKIEPYTHGLEIILKEEYLSSIVEELSYWQSWQKPFSRISVLWLYRLSLFLFSMFLIYQANVVINALII